MSDFFDNEYKTEAARRWGNTEAYKEYEAKAGVSAETIEGLDNIIGEFAACKQNNNAPDSGAAQGLVCALQAYITANFYTCTDEILAGLGSMYAGDERFRSNIDKHGDGTAEFISEAIKIRLK